jgi:hypothetical protein
VNADAETSGDSATAQTALRNRHREKVMRLDSLLKSDRCTLVFEATGDDKVRVTCQSWGDAHVILADPSLQVVALGKILHVCRVYRPAEF